MNNTQIIDSALATIESLEQIALSQRALLAEERRLVQKLMGIILARHQDSDKACRRALLYRTEARAGGQAFNDKINMHITKAQTHLVAVARNLRSGE